MPHRLLIVAALLATSACSLVGGISRERAIELASAGAPDDARLVSAEIGQLGAFADANTLPGEPRDREVWAIVLSGTFPGECVVTASGGSACPPEAESQLVVLDALTGELLYTTSPAEGAGEP